METGNLFEVPEVRKFLDDIHELMVEQALVKGARRDERVLEFSQPENLECKLDLEITDEGQSDERLLQACQKVIQFSVKTCHPRFLNQFYSGLNPYALSGAWLTDSLNTISHTYEEAPIVAALEKYMFRKLCDIVGYEDGDGVFVPGGSVCNMLPVHLARFRAVPELKEEGVFGHKRLIIYTSEDAHYSSLKGAMLMGHGSRSLVKIAVDERGRLVPEELERHITEDRQAGHLPIFVLATCGSTVLGSYDNLVKIADVCSRNGVWLHADLAWGGGVLLSTKHRHLVHGIERTDSISWNLHKMCNVPLQCTAFLVKEKGIMQKSYRFTDEDTMEADSLYDRSYDIGDKSVQCGRNVDVIKLWLMWKAIGDKGMADHVDLIFDNSRYFAEKIKKTEGFRLVLPEFQCTNVCFWYIPESLRNQEETEEWWKKVSKVAPCIKEKMMRQGTMMIGYTPMTSKGLVNFFRIVIEHPCLTYDDMEFVIMEIDRLGKLI